MVNQPDLEKAWQQYRDLRPVTEAEREVFLAGWAVRGMLDMQVARIEAGGWPEDSSGDRSAMRVLHKIKKLDQGGTR